MFLRSICAAPLGLEIVYCESLRRNLDGEGRACCGRDVDSMRNNIEFVFDAVGSLRVVGMEGGNLACRELLQALEVELSLIHI